LLAITSSVFWKVRRSRLTNSKTPLLYI
jgi:hypothetical protein